MARRWRIVSVERLRAESPGAGLLEQRYSRKVRGLEPPEQVGTCIARKVDPQEINVSVNCHIIASCYCCRPVTTIFLDAGDNIPLCFRQFVRQCNHSQIASLNKK